MPTVDNNSLNQKDGRRRAVVFLIDESVAMDARVAEGTKSKAESIATALNSLLNQLTTLAELDVAIVGYRTDAQGKREIGCRWAGALAGAKFVSTGSLAESPLKVEDRVRKLPGPGGVGVAGEQTVKFPIWYVPTLAEAASRAAALDYCRTLLEDWLKQAGPNAEPPLVVDLLGQPSEEDEQRAADAVERIRQLESPSGPPLVMHAHLGSLAGIPPTLYPSGDAQLPAGTISRLFHSASVLPEPFTAALANVQVTVNPGAKGLIYNAKMVDLIRFFSIVKTYATYETPRATPTPSPPPVAASDAAPAEIGAKATPLVVLVLDRSESASGVWRRLEEHANELLGQIAKLADANPYAAVVSHASDPAGGADARTGFEGPLAGRSTVAAKELAEGALRIEQFTEQVSNGIGGLISLKRKRPIFVDLQPGAAPAVVPAFEAVAQLLADWRAEHPRQPCLPIVVHLTRGLIDADELRRAVELLRGEGGAILCHLIVTESPHPVLEYPADPERIQTDELRAIWQWTDPLPAADRLAEKKRSLTAQSRAIVINCKFNLLPHIITTDTS